jgi:histidinol-phosphatase
MGYEREVAAAKYWAEQAGKLAAEFQLKGVTAELKADESPVTAADRACEKLIVESIEGEFPGDGVLGEEGSSRKGSSSRKWIVDPIDGTRDFVRGIPLWAVLIGLEDQGEIVAGCAYCPGQHSLVWASKGGGTWSNGERVHVSDRSEPAQSVLSFNGFNKAGVALFDGLLPWVARFGSVRGLGGAFDAILLATGRADVWIEPNAQPWDLAALKIVVEEAGGSFGAFNGSNSIYEGNGWACTAGLKPYVANLLKFPTFGS